MTTPHPTRQLNDPQHHANRPVCESADDAFLPTGVNPGPCSDRCPKHGCQS